MLLAEGLAEEELIMLVLHEKKNQMLQLYINVYYLSLFIY